MSMPASRAAMRASRWTSGQPASAIRSASAYRTRGTSRAAGSGRWNARGAERQGEQGDRPQLARRPQQVERRAFGIAGEAARFVEQRVGVTLLGRDDSNDGPSVGRREATQECGRPAVGKRAGQNRAPDLHDIDRHTFPSPAGSRFENGRDAAATTDGAATRLSTSQLPWEREKRSI